MRSCCAGTASVSTTRAEDHQLPVKTALHPAGPSPSVGLVTRAARHSPCAGVAAGRAGERSPSAQLVPSTALQSPSTGLVSWAARQSPFGGPDQAVTANHEEQKAGSMTSKKRRRELSPLHIEAAIVAASAAHLEAAKSGDHSAAPNDKTHEPGSKRVKREELVTQPEPPLLSKGHQQAKQNPSDTIDLISDSDEEKPSRNPSLTKTSTPTHTPNQSFNSAAGISEAPNTGSATDPIVIEITESEDDEDQLLPDLPDQAVQPLSEQTPPQLESPVSSLFLSFSDDTPDPKRTPSTHRGSQAAKGSHPPLERSTTGSHLPLRRSTKGSQPPLTESVKGSPGSAQGSPAASPSSLWESMRNAACSSGMLSAPRRTRSSHVVSNTADCSMSDPLIGKQLILWICPAQFTGSN